MKFNRLLLFIIIFSSNCIACKSESENRVNAQKAKNSESKILDRQVINKKEFTLEEKSFDSLQYNNSEVLSKGSNEIEKPGRSIQHENQKVEVNNSMEQSEIENSKSENQTLSKGILKFLNNTYDFGFITMGDQVDYDFKFINTGSSDINISNVEASCGCTTPIYPFIPIEPGESGKISVHFNSKGRLGSQTATITVYSDASEKIQKLNLTGVIRDKEADSNRDSL